jgi:hypothetical protein
MPPLKLLDNLKCKWFFCSSHLDIELGKNEWPSVLLCDHTGLVLSLVEGGAKVASTSSTVEEGDQPIKVPFPNGSTPKRIKKTKWELN